MSDQTMASRVPGSLLDRLSAIETVHVERASRDEADWETFGALFDPDAVVEVSWFRGDGPTFVEASRKQAAAGLQVLHHLTTCRALIEGDRAVVRAACMITTITPMRVGEVEVSITADARLHYRLRREGQGWKVGGLTAVYLKDAVTPAALGQSIAFDPARLSAARPSYKYLTYLMAERGITVPQTLAGSDLPVTVEAVVAGDTAWLAAGV